MKRPRSERQRADESPDKKVLREAYSRFKRAYDWEAQFRTQYVIDVKFANADSDNGWQWPEELRRWREVNKRPALTINKTSVHIALVTNDQRKNKPSISIKPTGGEATFQAAQVYEGIIRNIEYISNAQSIYDEACESQVEGGIAYWRVITEYTDENSFDQECRIAPVLSHLGVLLDCDIKQKDGSDAQWGFIFDETPTQEWEDRHPDEPVPDSSDELALGMGWMRPDTVRSAEYYRLVDDDDDELIYMEDKDGNGQTFQKSQIPKGITVEKFLEDGVNIKRRPIKRKKLEWYKIEGDKIVDRRLDLPGKYIPIVRVVGKERIIEGKLERKGLTRDLKDPQRMYNYNSPLCLSTRLPTPTGWTTMGEVSMGDWLFDEGGKPVRVAGLSPVFIKRKCYRVNFDDGSHIIADEQHLWTVEERGKRKTQTFDWQTRTIKTSELTPKKHFIYSTQPLELPGLELPVHPYILGCWLGDGNSYSGSITSDARDVDDARSIYESFGYQTYEPRYSRYQSAASIALDGLRGQLSRLGVLKNKHIPEMYLRASKEQREWLLQGLMDSDGHVTPSKQCVFVNTNERLVDGFSELLRSLGIKAIKTRKEAHLKQFPNGETYECLASERFAFSTSDIQVFRTPRKLSVHQSTRKAHSRRTKRHGIVSVIEVPSVPVRCVVIDSKSHLFLAGESMIPTHNSGQVEYGALATKSPWVGPAAAFEGNENAWKNANTNNAAYLTFKHKDEDGEPIPAPQRPEAPGSSPAFVNGMQIAEHEMAMVSGQWQAQQGMPSNEKSGVAIQQRQRQGDTSTYHFLDNLMLAIRYTGKILIDLIPKVYDTARIQKVLARDGTESQVKIDPNAQQGYAQQQDGDILNVVFNPNVGKYDVAADIGPNFATQRQEAFNAFVQIVSSNPELINQIGDLMFMSADFPLADKIADRLRRQIRQNAPWLLDDNAPTPQVLALQQQIEQASQMISGLLEKLGDQERKLRDQTQDLKIKAYDSESKRITAVSNAQPELNRTGQEDVVREMILQVLNDMQNTSIQPTDVKPPVDGAKQAPDGSWYVQDPTTGAYFKVDNGEPT